MAYKVPAFNTKTLEASALALLSEMLFSVTSDFQKEYRYGKKWLDSVSAAPVTTDAEVPSHRIWVGTS